MPPSPMTKPRSSSFSRQLLLMWILFATLILCIILLFAWLILRSLSQREIESVLLDTRAEAEELADRMAKEGREGLAEGDLLLLMSNEEGVLRLIEEDLAGNEAVDEIVIRDAGGRIIYRHRRGDEEGGLAPEDDEPLEVGDLLDGEPVIIPPQEAPPERLELPIGELGTMLVTISLTREDLQERIAVLREELIGKVIWVMVITLLVLLAAYVLVWKQIQRTRRAEIQAQEADRLAYIGTLAAGLAHEIRSPLNSMNLNMQMLEEEAAESAGMPTGKRLLSITRGEIQRLEGLVSDFLLYARPRALEIEEVRPAELLDSVAELLAEEARSRGAVLRVSDEAGDARVAVDRSQVTQLLLNLTQNALAATEESPRPGEIVLAARMEGSRVALVVEDNGIGIPADEQERIFEVFYSNRRGGTGLGLAVVERIAQNHGGEVRIESRVGEGTRMIVLLPAAGGA